MPLRLQGICKLTSGGGQGTGCPSSSNPPPALCRSDHSSIASNGPVCGSLWGGLITIKPPNDQFATSSGIGVMQGTYVTFTPPPPPPLSPSYHVLLHGTLPCSPLPVHTKSRLQSMPDPIHTRPLYTD